MKATEKIRDEEKSCKKIINGRIKHIIVRNNKGTNNISKFDQLESKEREQSDIENVQNEEKQMENQITEGYKTEENVNTSEKRHKKMQHQKKN